MCATFALVGEAEVLKLACSGERRFRFDHKADGAKPSGERSLRDKGIVLWFFEPIWFWSSDLASWIPASIRSAIHSNSGFASAGPTAVVGAGRFELPTPCSRSKCATRLRYAPPIVKICRSPPPLSGTPPSGVAAFVRQVAIYSQGHCLLQELQADNSGGPGRLLAFLFDASGSTR